MPVGLISVIRSFDSLFIHVIRGEVRVISALATIHTQFFGYHCRPDSMIRSATEVDSQFFETRVRHADHIICNPCIERTIFVLDFDVCQRP